MMNIITGFTSGDPALTFVVYTYAGIGLNNPWRYCPNTLYDILVSVR